MSLFDSASLVVTPNGYKEDKLYSIKPTDGSGDLVVTRATTATRVNSAGLVELVPYNLYTYSEQFNNAVWDKVSVTVTPDTTVSPNGSTTADTLVISSSGYLYRQVDYTSVVGDSITMSVYTKNSDANFLRFANSTIAGTDSNQIINVGDGWYRHIVTRTFTTSTTGIIQFLLGFSFTGTYYIWGAQLVQGTSAKEYFPTTDRLDIPRLDYTNSSCPSILVEPQRTNLVTYSEQFDNAAWAKTRATITANATTSPDGNNTADLLSDTTFTNNINYTENFISVSANITTISVFVKKGTAPYVSFGFYDNDFHGFVVNTTTWASSHTFGSATNFTATNYGNGWYRLSMTKQSATNFIYPSIAVQQNSNGSAYNGTGALNAYFWGYQIEVGSYATSYIPTIASSVTRNADVISKTGISSLIGQTEGTILLDIYRNSQSESFGAMLANSLGTNSYMNSIYLFQVPNNLLTCDCFVSNSQQFSLQLAGGLSNGRHKIALAYKQNDAVLYVDGVLIDSDTSCNIPSMSAIDISQEFTASNYKNNVTALWKTRLSNTELATLTTI